MGGRDGDIVREFRQRTVQLLGQSRDLGSGRGVGGAELLLRLALWQAVRERSGDVWTSELSTKKEWGLAQESVGKGEET